MITPAVSPREFIMVILRTAKRRVQGHVTKISFTLYEMERPQHKSHRNRFQVLFPYQDLRE